MAHWICPVAEDHRWQSQVADRAKGIGCPCCSGAKVVKSNSLATTHPQMLREWDYTRNTVTPEQVRYGSLTKVWWKCSVAEDHSWEATIHNRVNGTGCPCCSGAKVVMSNCIATTHPHILSEWDYERNTVPPEQLSFGSKKAVHWICKAGHRWKAMIQERTRRPYGCPSCDDSRGERLIEKTLVMKGVKYKKEYTDPRCRNILPLRFDFAFWKENQVALIEFQGEQHYRPVSWFGGEKAFTEAARRDNIKRKFCSENQISLLEIKYSDFDKTEQLVVEFIERLTKNERNENEKEYGPSEKHPSPSRS